MDFVFKVVPYDRAAFLSDALPSIPKTSAVYRIFDTHGQLIVLDKTSNLFQRLERFFGPHLEKVKDLDLSAITSRIEFVRTASPFETAYVLYLERRRAFPKTYRKMRTFRFFTLMKINRRQRFPRIYASREIKTGVDYFGPFLSRAQFGRVKTTLERTFRLRPCPYNIRGNDPHPDCLYFQIHSCSRPCNNDIDRAGYFADVQAARAFVQGHDAALADPLISRIGSLALETRFEEAEVLRRQLEKLRHARQEVKDTFVSVWDFDYLVVLPAETSSHRKIAFVRAASIIGFEEYEVTSLVDALQKDLERFYGSPLRESRRDWQYDEFCLVSSFLVDPLQSADLIPFSPSADFAATIQKRIEDRKHMKKETQA